MAENSTDLAVRLRRQIAHLLATALPGANSGRAAEIAEAIDLLIMMRIAERDERNAEGDV
jgi:hypothetical protein